MKINEDIKLIINRIKIDESWMGKSQQLLHHLTRKMALQCSSVMDVGKSSRDCWDLFPKGKIISADINQFDGYPDIIIDICDSKTFPDKPFDGIICHSILEHTYAPFSAVRNMYDHLTDNGIFLGFVPFLMQYHAPANLKFQDFFRFSRDGIAYLFREFDEVTLYPVRGKMSSVVSLLYPIKRFLSKNQVEYLSNYIDRLFSGKSLQTTGYIIYAVKNTALIRDWRS